MQRTTSTMNNLTEELKSNRFAQIGLILSVVLVIRGMWLSFGDKKIYTYPQRQYKALIAKRPRGMRIGDIPEYLLSLITFGMIARYSNIPLNLVISVMIIGVISSMFLHRPVQRFRYMWRLTFLCWCLVIGYSCFTQYFIPLCHWSLIPVGYIGALLMFYVWHITAHQPWTGRLYKVHMRHHIELYPPKKYLSDKHKTSHTFFSSDGFFHEGPLYLLIIIELFILKYLYNENIQQTDNQCIYFLIFGLGIFGYLGNQLHYAFHIRGHWLEQMEWFLMLRELHWIHHKGDMKKNYMLLNFSMDELFSSKDYVRFVDERNAGTLNARVNDKKSS